MCNKSWNEAFGEKLFNFMLFNYRYFVLCHPTNLRSQAIVAMQSIMLPMGTVCHRKLACAMRVEMKHLKKRYSTLCCWISDILSFVTPPLCVHSHLWQCNHYACDGFVCQKKLACAIRVEVKNLERRDSSLCCSNSDILSFVTPAPSIHRHLWKTNPLCLRWGLCVKRSMHMQ